MNIISEGDGAQYEVDTLLNCHYPIKDQQACSVINVCVFVNTIQKELEMDMKDSSLNHHALESQQTYTIINVRVFVNAIQKEMEIDME